MRHRSLVFAAVALAILAAPVFAGEYHATETNVCYDCHTMHYSMQHGWDGGAVGSTSTPGGNWLGTGGPYHYLLKADVNQICLQCHNGQTFAPDVYGTDTNAGVMATAGGRQAGALNGSVGSLTPGAGYDDWKGHTLDSTATPPGYDNVSAGFGAYTPADGLKCFNCHTQHGRAEAYRNLGPRRSTVPSANFFPTYTISTVFDPTFDVTIGLASYVPDGTAANFAPYYSTNNVRFGRNDIMHGADNLQSSNPIDQQCSACHGDFHGGAGDPGILGNVTTGEFERHPTSGVNIGAIGGGHSNLARYVAATNKVKVYTDDQVTFTNSSPGCVSCHKAHGNQNPFGLIFMNRLAGTVTEQGTTTVVTDGLRDLCGQCHVQGN